MPIDPIPESKEADDIDLGDIFDRLQENASSKPVHKPNFDEGTPFDLPVAEPTAAPSVLDEGMSADEFLASSGIVQEREVPDIFKPWMKHHDFVPLHTIEEVNKLINAILDPKTNPSGHCSLDIESEGLDNRIFYENDDINKPYTKHKIVGFCLAYGEAKQGYYIPVRHTPKDGGTDLNVKPIAEVEAAIKRLCVASQPLPKPGATDSLAFREFSKPPQVVIDFWHASFDQEFLYPITGIDFWHPESFECGYLACFVKYTSDKNLSLKDKAEEVLKDPDGNPYVMIKLKELFPIRGSKIEFHLLSPDEPGVVRYACSDAICTRLLCSDKPTPQWSGYLAHNKMDEGKTVVQLVQEKYNFIYRVEKQVAQVKRVMERNRVKINTDRIKELRERHIKTKEEISSKIQEFAFSKGYSNFEPGSPKQLSEMLFSKDGLDITLPGRGPDDKDFPNGKPPINEKSKQYKTGGEVLEEMAKIMEDNAPPILKWIVAFREEDKVISTYLEGLADNPDKETNELRFQFKQTGAATGRFSAPAGETEHGYSGIPIHGIPATSDLRTCFVAREGYTMVKCDYAGEELRIVANLSNEQVWIKEFLEGSGDLHSITARAFFGKQDVSKDERKAGKCVHPDTVTYVDGRLTTLRSSLTFSEHVEEFRETAGTVHDGDSWKKLTATFNGGEKPLVHVVLSGGLLTCTEKHRFEMRDGSFKQAGDLQCGDLVRQVSAPLVVDRDYQILCVNMWEGLPPAHYLLSHDLAYFAGLFVGDGTGNVSSAALSHGAAGIIDDYGHDYEEWIQSLEKSCHTCGFTTTRKDKAQLYLGSRVVVRFLRSLGIQGKAQKSLRVPAWVLEAGRESILHYLGGLFDTDGTVHKGHALDWTSKSFVLGGQIATAMRACGLDFNTELTFNKTYKKYYVRLRLTVASSWQLVPYMKHSGKVSRLRAPIYEGRQKDRFQVLKVLPAGEGSCVDISVGTSHRYLANGFVTHNTANFALIYGGGPAAIMRATGCDRMEGQRRKAAFDKSVPDFAKWVKSQHAKVKKELGVWTAFGRWVAYPDANSLDNAIKAACERNATNSPIQGSGADILKISMILLHKEFYDRRWLKNSPGPQADTVRMLLTVHDEIVFEIKHDMVTEVIPIIVKKMEAPALWPKPPHSPRWVVPLVTEPLVGPTWGTGYPCEKATADHKLKEGDYLVNGFIYGTIRSVDLGKEHPGKGEVEHEVDEKGKKVKFRMVEPLWLKHVIEAPTLPLEGGGDRGGTSTPTTVKEPAAAPPVEAAVSLAATSPAPQAEAPKATHVAEPPKADSPPKVATMHLKLLTKATLMRVRGLCAEHIDPSGSLLRLMDPLSGYVLIDPKIGVRVDAEKFSQAMLFWNLSDGRVLFS